MRIDKVEIDGFGKLNNCTYTFSDGLNLIFGENESGKSTLCEFILAMFYGLPNESKRAGDDMSARKKYRPWNTESFGGRVYFTDDNGKRFVLERSFKSTKRSDKATLRSADTWEETGDAENVGEMCFGLSREAFLKTLYVKSFGADSLKNDDGEIMSRLSNLETSGDEDLSYSKIMNAMERDIYSLKTKTGKGGKIVALEEKIVSLQNELSMSAMIYSSLENDEKTAENLKNAAEEKEIEAKKMEEQYSIALLNEKYLSRKTVEDTKKVMEKRREEKKEELKNIILQLENAKNENISVVSAESISRARALETKQLIAEEKLEAMLNAKGKNAKKSSILPMMLVALAGIVVAVIGAFTNGYALIFGLAFALFGIFAAFFKKVKGKQKQSKEDIEIKETAKEIDFIKDELKEIFMPYGVTISDELASLYMLSQNKEQSKEILQQRYKECENEIKSLTESMPKDTEEENYSNDVIEYAGESAQKLFEKIKLLKSESKQMSERAHEILVGIAKKTAEMRTEDEIKLDLKDAESEKQELVKRYNSLVRAAEWLTLAHTEIKNNFAPRLNLKASALFSQLTHNKYEDIRSNDDFDINLKSTSGEIVEAGYMSRGTYDLLYIALRFAAMSVLTDGKIPPLILDDAFSQLDDKRLLSALELINNSTEFSQILLFTCHENYSDLEHQNFIRM